MFVLGCLAAGPGRGSGLSAAGIATGEEVAADHGAGARGCRPPGRRQMVPCASQHPRKPCESTADSAPPAPAAPVTRPSPNSAEHVSSSTPAVARVCVENTNQGQQGVCARVGSALGAGSLGPGEVTANQTQRARGPVHFASA